MRPVSLLRRVALGVVALGSVLHVGLLFQRWHGMSLDAFTITALVLGPWLIVVACIALARNQTALGAAIAFAVGYLVVGTATYCWALYVEVDAQGELVFLYVPSIALPFGVVALLVVWVTGFKPLGGRLEQ